MIKCLGVINSITTELNCVYVCFPNRKFCSFMHCGTGHVHFDLVKDFWRPGYGVGIFIDSSEYMYRYFLPIPITLFKLFFSVFFNPVSEPMKS
jgi:hypothetical protein